MQHHNGYFIKSKFWWPKNKNIQKLYWEKYKTDHLLYFHIFISIISRNFFYPPNKRRSNGPIPTQVCCPPSSQGNFSSKIHCVHCVICLLFDPEQVACTQFLVKSAVCSCCYKLESSKHKPKLYHKTPQRDSLFKDAQPLIHSFLKI